MKHHVVEAGDVSLHCVSEGEGPLVLMCHGYPGLWYSWRHQIPAIAAAGFKAVAMDMRGYGRSSRPASPEAYGFDSTAGDVLAVLDYFGADNAVMLGHDFGANLAWHMAVHHSDRIRAVAPLCVPYGLALAGAGDVCPSELYAQIAQQHFFHMHYYQQPQVPEQNLLGREREFLQKLFWALSARGELLSWDAYPSEGTCYLDVLAEPEDPLPWSWLSAQDMAYYVDEYLNAEPELAFIGGINSYRAMDRNWHMFGASNGAPVEIPVLWVGGAEDPVTKLTPEETFAEMRNRLHDLRGFELLPGAGHFIQQEAPQRLNALLVDFIAQV